MSKELSILKRHFKGPIKQITDPRDHAVDETISSYFREILWLARKYTRPTVEYEDLVVEGLIGLLDAIQRWDPEKARGNPKSFHNLAIVRIKSNMFEYFLSNNSMYTVPNYMARALALIDQIRTLLNSREYEGNPEEDLRNYAAPAFEATSPPAVVKKLQELKGRVETLADSSGKTYEEMVADVLKVERDIEAYEKEDGDTVSPEQEAAQRDFLFKFLDNLTPRAKKILARRLQGDTCVEIGVDIGLTRERVRQIEAQALRYFRETRMYLDATEGVKEEKPT